MSKFEVFKDKKDQHRWRLVASNGEIVAQSESYDSQSHARRGVADAKLAMQESHPEVVYVEGQENEPA